MSKTDILRLSEYLRHILEAIERIHRYIEDMSEVAFLEDEKTQDAIIRNFEIIGEASNNIQRNHAEFSNAHPDLPLDSAYEMRNALSHGYFKVDLEVLWKTVHTDLPELHTKIRLLLEQLK